MTVVTSPDNFIELSEQYPVIDVRSPGEFASGHIPGASNVPLFTDEERAEVGTTYMQTGREAAICLGLEIVSPKIPQLLESTHAVSSAPEVLVHCWRGGMRSQSVARLLESDGFRPKTLDGGYKAFRRMAHRVLAEPRPIVILCGLSGSGKTRILLDLQADGEQVIDLEGLARHRGSAFGGIGQPSQPSTEQFENELFRSWRGLDPTRVVWLESESQLIGNVAIPQPIWQQMLDAPAIRLEVEREVRTEQLISDYGDLPPGEIELALGKIKKRLGGQRYNEAVAALTRGDLYALTNVVLDYYDRAYSRSCETISRPSVTRLTVATKDRVELHADLRHLASLSLDMQRSA